MEGIADTMHKAREHEAALERSIAESEIRLELLRLLDKSRRGLANVDVTKELERVMSKVGKL